MASLGIPAVMLIMALMWIGASPDPQVVVSNDDIRRGTDEYLESYLRKKYNIVRNKEISQSTLNQVNAVILLSIFAISFGSFLFRFSTKT